MKVGCISWSHRNEFSDGSMDIFSWIRHCARDVKVDGVEIWNGHLTSLEGSYLDSVSSALRGDGLTLYTLASKLQYGDFGVAEIEQAKATLRTWLTATNQLGAPTLRISIGGNNLGGRERKDIVFTSIAAVLDEGTHPHIAVAIENQEPGVVANSTDVLAMDRVSDGKVKLLLDNGSIIDKATVYRFMEESLPYAAGVHVKFFDVREDGSDRVLDYDRIIPILRSAGYEGYLSIEFDSQERASDNVPRIADYLRRQLA